MYTHSHTDQHHANDYKTTQRKNNNNNNNQKHTGGMVADEFKFDDLGDTAADGRNTNNNNENEEKEEDQTLSARFVVAQHKIARVGKTRTHAQTVLHATVVTSWRSEAPGWRTRDFEQVA